MATQTDDQKAKDDAEAKAEAARKEAEAKAKADAERAARPADQTDAGGRYLVGGVLVDANGTPVKG